MSDRSKPRLLDLFCGAGGAGMGYHRAGFDVVGVDIEPQPHYPFEFHQADALEFLAELGGQFHAIHASPPCQGYSIMRNLPWLRDKDYPMLIVPVRTALGLLRVPHVIENVKGARHTAQHPDGLQAAFLCGMMFGLPFYRHRYFETNWFWMQPGHPRHTGTIRAGNSIGGRARDIIFYPSNPRRPKYGFDGPSGVGHHKGVEQTRLAMGVDWMRGDESSQAIPPAYTEYIGRDLLRCL